MRTPEHPSDLDIQVGGDSWWPGQREAIERVLDAFDEYPYVILDAPTGSGKTIIATAVQRIMGLWSVMLTHSIGLQSQALKTMPWAEVVTGRANHDCELDQMKMIGAKADKAPCAMGAECEYQSGEDACGYYAMLDRAAGNPQAVLNYAYATRILRSPGVKGQKRNPFRRQMLVCDEADLAEGAIIDSTTVKINRASVARFDPPRGGDVLAWATWAVRERARVKAQYDVARGKALCKHDSISCQPCNFKAPKVAMTDYRVMKGLMEATEALCEIDDPSDWIAVGERGEVVIRPLWGWTVAEKVVFRHFEKVLLMSATITETDVDKLGIPKDQRVFVNLPSFFPTENRPLFYIPVVQMNSRAGPEEFDKMARAISGLAEQEGLKGRKGIVHTGSFKIARELYVRLAIDSDRYVAHLQPELAVTRGVGGVESRKIKDQIIHSLRTDPRPLIALSPSLMTGVDIPYEIGFQMIVKVPFAYLGDPVVKARLEYRPPFGRKAYEADAMNAVVQAYGRAVRTPTDHGVSYVLDKAFWGLYKRTEVAQHVRDAVKWVGKGG